ncbi:MAG: multidrug efflux SMR transporter [Streptococcaceae bacterium]|jgi:small multidrug resistance pump|nr:multidrug efflux SMR transporter [Streptococcaceae bacterium]
MKFIFLIGGILAEVVGTTFMKLSDGYSKFTYTGLTVAFYILSLFLMSKALKYFDVGLAYAVWSGVGIVCLGVIGIFFFKEDMTLLKASFMLLIIVGVVGLNYISKPL